MRDPLVGNVFENLIVVEALKSLYNKGQNPSLYFFRDNNGREIDLLYDAGSRLKSFEIKSTSTYQNFFIKKLKKIKNLDSSIQSTHFIYNGEDHKLSNQMSFINFKKTSSFF